VWADPCVSATACAASPRTVPTSFDGCGARNILADLSCRGILFFDSRCCSGCVAADLLHTRRNASNRLNSFVRRRLESSDLAGNLLGDQRKGQSEPRHHHRFNFDKRRKAVERQCFRTHRPVCRRALTSSAVPFLKPAIGILVIRARSPTNFFVPRPPAMVPGAGEDCSHQSRNPRRQVTKPAPAPLSGSKN
jgi:hypothetical protein